MTGFVLSARRLRLVAAAAMTLAIVAPASAPTWADPAADSAEVTQVLADKLLAANSREELVGILVSSRATKAEVDAAVEFALNMLHQPSVMQINIGARPQISYQGLASLGAALRMDAQQLLSMSAEELEAAREEVLKQIMSDGADPGALEQLNDLIAYQKQAPERERKAKEELAARAAEDARKATIMAFLGNVQEQLSKSTDPADTVVTFVNYKKGETPTSNATADIGQPVGSLVAQNTTFTVYVG